MPSSRQRVGLLSLAEAVHGHCREGKLAAPTWPLSAHLCWHNYGWQSDIAACAQMGNGLLTRGSWWCIVLAKITPQVVKPSTGAKTGPFQSRLLEGEEAFAADSTVRVSALLAAAPSL